MLQSEIIGTRIVEYKKEIGQRIKARREELGISQGDLAKRLLLKNRSSISLIETGVKSIPMKQLDLYAKVLHTTPQWLMGWADDPDIEAGMKAAELMTDDDTLAFVDHYKQLNNSNQAAVRTMVDSLLAQQNANKT